MGIRGELGGSMSQIYISLKFLFISISICKLNKSLKLTRAVIIRQKNNLYSLANFRFCEGHNKVACPH